ncbi:fused MFS/spermidine synthase [Dermatophilaceae bacterium Sec6.4]
MAEIEFVTDERGGVTVMRDGHPQSHVQPEDPRLLVFEYIQHLALVLDTLPTGPLGVTHIGGAGLTLPRYIEATRPGSPQIVLEPDVQLTEQVRREIPLPRRHRIRVRPIEGAAGIGALRDASADVIVLDAYADGRVPADLTGTGFLNECARVLAPTGVLLANLADEPGLHFVRRFLATVPDALCERAVIATNEVLKGRRFGNFVVAASAAPLDHAALRRAAARANFPTGVRLGAEVTALLRSIQPFGQLGEQSPQPPDPGAWRLR